MQFTRLFNPAIWVMRRLRLPVKLAMLSLALLVPLVVVAVMLIQRVSADITFTQNEQFGARVIDGVSDLVAEVQKHRGQTNLAKAGNPGAPAALADTRRAQQRLLGDIDRELASRPDLGLVSLWAPLKARVEGLTQTEGMDAPNAFRTHSELVQSLQRFVYATADRSGLLFDPEPGSYLLMDMAVSRTLPWTEALGQIRGQGAGQLARSEPQPEVVNAVRLKIEMAQGDIGDASAAIDLLKRHIEVPPGSQAAIATSGEFLAAARGAFDRPGSLEAAAYFEQGTRAIGAVAAFQDAVLKSLNTQLSARLSALEQRRWVAVGATFTGIALLMYLMAGFYLSFVGDFNRVMGAMRATAAGNLQHAVAPRGRDELAELTELLARMMNNISAMVAQIRSNSALVAHAGKSLADGNRELADRTEQQAASLEQTAASVQELTSTVAQNAQTANESDQQAARVRDVAEQGAQSMGHAVASVEGIQRSAQRMNEIIGVIDSLAFQTNILALNAAVEAARAGEQGRGFAVVANEVRTLAQRSAASAKEIRELIESSSSQVSSSVSLIRGAGESIGQIVGGVRGVASNMSLISASSAEQSSGLSEISSAVSQLDQITQRNAQMVERAVHQANLLEQRAASLASAVASFKLQQGTAEEAMALVDRALDQRQRLGRDEFVRQLTEPSSGFHDRDMYVFALDRTGVYRAFGGKPEKVGSRVQDIPGVDGQALLSAIIAQAEQGAGWVEYDIVNPVTGAVQTKMSYVVKVDDLYVGCGVYKTAALLTAA